MKDAMVDTMVLAYATAGGGSRPSDEVKRMVADSSALLLQMEVIYIATITATEFLPFVKPEHAAKADGIVARFHRLPFDAAAEAIATKLIRDLRRSPARCPVCLGIREAAACKGCGNTNSVQQKKNDIYIAATAAAADKVRVLYTYDRGILALAPELSMLEISRPPSAWGEIFDTLLPTAERGLPPVARVREVSGEAASMSTSTPPSDEEE